MGQALYRTYRPQALAEVIGQEHITDTLTRAIKAGRISHAYLFTGPRGVGKTSVARILAHEINSLPYTEDTTLDIIEIDAASNRRIDDIRDLREKVHITPVSAKYKVYIIDEVHMLTGESFNALLKTLEEPPAHVVFILATTESHKLPATIVSRTQRFAFRPVTKQKVMAHLRTIANKEKIDITDDALALIADHGEGSFRDSISLLDQLAHVSTTKITTENVIRALGLASGATITALVEAILTADRDAISRNLAQLESGGTAIGALVAQLSQALLAEAVQKPSLYGLIDNLLDAPRAYNPSLKLLSVIMVYTLAQPVVRVATPPPQPAAPTVRSQKPSASVNTAQEPTRKRVVAPAAKTSEPAQPTAQLTAMSPHDWGKILSVVKETEPALFAVIKQAQPVVGESGQLVLKFKFMLHSKKIEDLKVRSTLASLIEQAIGTAPIITAEVDKLAIPLTAVSDDTADIAAIMGGGEVIPHAETV